MSAPLPGRTLPLRRWLAIGFFAIIISFVVPFVVTFGIIYHTGQVDYGENLQWAKHRVDDDFARWTDPAWQSDIAETLADRHVDGVFSVDGQEIFRTTGDPFAGAGNDGVQVIRVSATENGVVYQADLSTEAQVGPPAALRYVLPVAIALVVTTITGAALFLRRTVVDPLAATSAAAGRVAVGELDVELPGSRVREVADVNSAFSGMSAALRASLEQQAKLEEERRLFIGAVAHDLRTPLFSLRGSLEGLATGIANTPEKQERYLTVAREKADNLERLIADLFDYTRLEYLEQAHRRWHGDAGRGEAGSASLHPGTGSAGGRGRSAYADPCRRKRAR
jgi:signal transduction histidine kinase